MKSALNFVMICLVALVMSCGNQADVKESASDQDFTSMASLDLKVSGMKCEFGCAKTIEKKVSEMAGVGGCFVEFEEGKAKVYFDDETISRKEIISFISDMNEGSYEVSEIENSNEDEAVEDAKIQGNNSNVFSPGQSFRLPELITYFLRRI